MTKNIVQNISFTIDFSANQKHFFWAMNCSKKSCHKKPSKKDKKIKHLKQGKWKIFKKYTHFAKLPKYATVGQIVQNNENLRENATSLPSHTCSEEDFWRLWLFSQGGKRGVHNPQRLGEGFQTPTTLTRRGEWSVTPHTYLNTERLPIDPWPSSTALPKVSLPLLS